MKKLRLFSAILSLILILSFALTACTVVKTDKEVESSTVKTDGETDAPEIKLDRDLEIKISVLNGTTGFGAAKLYSDAKEKKTTLNYNISVETDAANIQAGLINGSVDIAALPTNAAAALYNKTNGGVKIAAVNTLGVLYLMTNGTTVTSISDLKGKTVYTPAQNPAFIFEAICRANDLTPGEDITIDTAYAQPADLRAALVSGKVDIAVLPEPMVTIAKSANADLSVSLDLTEEWEKVYGENSLMQGCIVVRTSWADSHPNELREFLKEYEESVKFTTENPKEASELIVSGGIFAGNAAVAEKAIPKCNIVYMDSEDNISECLGEFFKALYDVKPQSIGGALPDSGLYLGK
ncbi:MAG: ABC transporter substrate-binding protein [Eubacteriales bacterium]